MMENLFWLGIVGAVLALVFALIQGIKVIKYPKGNETMETIAGAIRTGAGAYLKRQYTTVTWFFCIMFIILGALAFIPVFAGAEKGFVSPFVPFAFIIGGFFTGLSGFIGMKIATLANSRTTNAAQQGLNRGLRVAFSSGTVMGFTVAGLGLLDVTAWYLVLVHVFHAETAEIAQTMICFGMGVASMAMFARVGGGIFTKAADVGADLVGKVEAGIPEDDPRNPAVIADNVGDNVGDVAGMGADLHESNSNSLVATIAISFGAGYGIAGFMLPIIISVIGILSSIVGTFFVRTKENINQLSLLNSIRRGVYIAGGIAAVATLPLIMYISKNAPAGSTMSQNAWGIYGAVLIGIVAGFIVSLFTEYFTSDASRPTRELAASSESGAAPLIIGGLSLGMKSTAGPIITVSGAALLSFIVSGGVKFLKPEAFFDGSMPLADYISLNYNVGLYGIGLAAVAMLATNAIILATDAFGPVADNAGGIAQMAKLPENVRERTDALDALGNTTAATGKGFAIASNAFTGLALLVSYVNIANIQLANIGKPQMNLAITNPPVLVGFFIGSAVVLLFAALCMSAVQRAAQSIVREVRRQFKEIIGLMEGKADADYATCVDICMRGALKEMISPAVLVILGPIATGILLGAAGVVGYLAGIIVTGFAMAVFMLNSGGAWDNAKKHIESGKFGGKGSDNHKAAVIGDTVGDPLKDTAGPSFNNVITVSCTVSIVFIGVTAALSLL